MKERPILFSAEMARAILDGRKTQTRRVVKPQPNSGPNGEMVRLEDELWALRDGDLCGGWKCPYGKPGDRLWVREGWRSGEYLDCYSPTKIKRLAFEAGYSVGLPCPIKYEVDAKIEEWGSDDAINFGDWGKFRSPRFMPRWASRIDLAITNVRVERVQDIDNNDAYAEGTPDIRTIENNWDLRDCFEHLWDSINGKREGCSWADNPWAWVIEFERIKP